MTNIIIADDHPIVRHGLRRLLNFQPDMTVTAEVADGAELVACLPMHPCDVLILDLSLPHIRGLELVLLLREQHPKLRILIFSVQPEDQLSLYLIDAGVSGYLCKDHGVEAVIEAVRLIARGGRYLSPALQALRDARAASQQPPHQRLSRRERQVFDRLIQGMSVTAIARELEVSTSTASNHLARIRDKLSVSHNGELIVYAARAGLL